MNGHQGITTCLEVAGRAEQLQVPLRAPSGSSYSVTAAHCSGPAGNENVLQHCSANMDHEMILPQALASPEEEAPNPFMSAGALLESGRKRKGGFGAGLGPPGGDRAGKGPGGQRRRVGLQPPRAFVPPFGAANAAGSAAAGHGEQASKKNPGKAGMFTFTASAYFRCPAYKCPPFPAPNHVPFLAQAQLRVPA
jgi:hypothetical protein